MSLKPIKSTQTYKCKIIRWLKSHRWLEKSTFERIYSFSDTVTREYLAMEDLDNGIVFPDRPCFKCAVNNRLRPEFGRGKPFMVYLWDAFQARMRHKQLVRRRCLHGQSTYLFGANKLSNDHVYITDNGPSVGSGDGPTLWATTEFLPEVTFADEKGLIVEDRNAGQTYRFRSWSTRPIAHQAKHHVWSVLSVGNAPFSTTVLTQGPSWNTFSSELTFVYNLQNISDFHSDKDFAPSIDPMEMS